MLTYLHVYTSDDFFHTRWLCDKVCQWLAGCRCFSVGTLVSCIIKTDRHDITEILLRVVLNTINHQPTTLLYTLICDMLWNKC